MEKRQLNTVTKKRIESQEMMSREGNIFSYSPFRDNDVLHVVYTSHNVILLMRNGTCVSWGSNRSTLGRRCVDSDADSYIPHPVKFPTKIVDIACGREHCIARGSNFKVYSWGQNAFGQLGLSGFPTNVGSEKDEPAEIQAFSNIKIKQIFSSGYSSFAITEGGNNLYGWGDNRNCQLGIHDDKKKIVEIPKLIELTDKSLHEIVVCQKKNGSKSYIAELHRPASSVSQAMIYYKNKQLHYKEIELKLEKEKIELQEEQIKKRKGILNLHFNQQETENLMKDINDLIGFYSSKLNKINKRVLEDKLTKNKEILKSYDMQIEHQKEKEKISETHMRGLTNNNDVNFKTHNSKFETVQLTEKKMDLRSQKKKVINFGKLIEDVNAGLHQNKHNTLGQHEVLQEKLKLAEQKMLLLGDYLAVFNKVKVEAKKLIDKKLEKESIKDLRNIMERLFYDQEALKSNLIRNYDQINPDSESLKDSILKSGENLEDLEDKVYEYNIDENNVLGLKMADCFKNNILLTKMNNILLDNILLYSKLYYNKSFERFLQEEEVAPKKVLDKIAKIKQDFLIEEQKIKEEEEQNKIQKSKDSDSIMSKTRDM